MRLMDVDFDRLATVRVKCIENDGQKAVSRWKNLYPLESVTGDAETEGFYLEVFGSKNFRCYELWNDCGGLLAVKYRAPIYEDREVSKLTLLAKYMEAFKGVEGYKKRLRQMEEMGEFIGHADIMSMVELGELELGMRYSRYREDYIAEGRRREEEKRARREAERRAEEEERKRAFEAKIAEAEDCIRRKEKLENEELEEGMHIVLCLMKKYNINVPLKTQGWINSKLVAVEFDERKGTKVWFYKDKGCKCSESVYRYLDELKDAVDAAGQR